LGLVGAEAVSAEAFWFGIGTGRCGTESLATLLNQQRQTHITHESKRLPWEVPRDGARRELHRLSLRPSPIVGDVAFYYLPYIRRLLEDPRVRVVALRRDRTQTVESYLRKMEGRNHWSTQGHRDDGWDRCYPTYEEPDLRSAIGRYWDEYYAHVEQLVEDNDRVALFPTEALNHVEGVLSILTFLGVADPVVSAGIHQNGS
jgi:hypothetical protein